MRKLLYLLLVAPIVMLTNCNDDPKPLPEGKHTITIATVAGGTATAKRSGQNTTTADSGQTITVTATPNEAYSFNSWSADNAAVEFADATAATTTFVMPDAAVTITPVFNGSFSFTVEGTGTVTAKVGEKELAPGVAEITEAGTTVTMTAAWDEGSSLFLGWSTPDGNVVFSDAMGKTTTFVMPAAAVNVTPVFAEATFETSTLHFIEGGTFTMGYDQLGVIAKGDEVPMHEVTLSSFYMARFELTQKEWVNIMGTNPSRFQAPDYTDTDDRPVEKISWNQAQEFIVKLRETTGLPYRLPTEAEWEFAARGGNLSKGFMFSGSNNQDEVSWYGGYNSGSTYVGNSANQTHPRGKLKANELGLYDMSGNVWEMVLDRYGDYPADALIDPVGPATGQYGISRGGSWANNYLFGNPYYRRITEDRATPSDGFVGLRLVLSPLHQNLPTTDVE